MNRPLAALFAVAAVAVAAPAFSKPPKAPPTPVAAPPPVVAPVAAPGPEKIIKYRELVMEGVAKHMGAMGLVVKGEVDRKQDLVAHAEALAALAPTIPALFPAGTGPEAGKTEAKPEVWTKWAEFEAANVTFVTESQKLVEVAKGGDFEAFKVQYGAVGKSCGGCHDGFRVDDK